MLQGIAFSINRAAAGSGKLIDLPNRNRKLKRKRLPPIEGIDLDGRVVNDEN